MADVEPEVNIAGMAASLYALGMSYPGTDRVEVAFSLSPTFEVELSEGEVSAESWQATATVRTFTMGRRVDFAEVKPETMVSETLIEGSYKGTPEGAQYSLQGRIRDKLMEEAARAQEASSRFGALSRAIR